MCKLYGKLSVAKLQTQQGASHTFIYFLISPASQPSKAEDAAGTSAARLCHWYRGTGDLTCFI